MALSLFYLLHYVPLTPPTGPGECVRPYSPPPSPPETVCAADVLDLFEFEIYVFLPLCEEKKKQQLESRKQTCFSIVSLFL